MFIEIKKGDEIWNFLLFNKKENKRSYDIKYNIIEYVYAYVRTYVRTLFRKLGFLKIKLIWNLKGHNLYVCMYVDV